MPRKSCPQSQVQVSSTIVVSSASLSLVSLARAQSARHRHRHRHTSHTISAPFMPLIPFMPSLYLSCHLCDNPSHKSHGIMKYAGQEGQQTFNASFIIAPLPPVPRYKFCFKICFLEQQNASKCVHILVPIRCSFTRH